MGRIEEGSRTSWCSWGGLWDADTQQIHFVPSLESSLKQKIDQAGSYLIIFHRISKFLPDQRNVCELYVLATYLFMTVIFSSNVWGSFYFLQVLAKRGILYQPSNVIKQLSLLGFCLWPSPDFSVSIRMCACSCKWVRRCGRVGLFALKNITSSLIKACLLPQQKHCQTNASLMIAPKTT